MNKLLPLPGSEKWRNIPVILQAASVLAALGNSSHIAIYAAGDLFLCCLTHLE
ncbi:hypothetical protein [Klebsiella oxytoca]|uniref:hypothetical protein n=1 Tax=Klebsiella oxytoca TaxID=571 RepID=UPI00157B1D57|nr:hypothetical protein [Klebsiella oxytoca]